MEKQPKIVKFKLKKVQEFEIDIECFDSEIEFLKEALAWYASFIFGNILHQVKDAINDKSKFYYKDGILYCVDEKIDGKAPGIEWDIGEISINRFKEYRVTEVENDLTNS